MTTFPNSVRLPKGDVALTDPDTSAVWRAILLQYNPTMLQVQVVSDKVIGQK